jgi:hypothetical protein
MGRYAYEDSEGKITYEANRTREFNKYINASDLLEEFVMFLGSLKVRQSQVLDITIEIFVNWLVIRAAQHDGDETPPDVKIADHPKFPRPGDISPQVVEQ